MKRTLLLMVAVFASLFLVSCTDTKTVLEDKDNSYVVTGQIAGWGDAVGKEEFLMEAIARGDERVKSLSKDLKKAKYIYILEVTFPEDFPKDENGNEIDPWNVEYTIDGEDVVVKGTLTVKVLKVPAGEEAPAWWGQNPESGKFKNLTPDTLYIPPYQEENVDNAGDWNGNPIAFKAGTYYVVYVQYGAASHGLALIKK